MVHRIECLGDVKADDTRPSGRLLLVEAICRSGDEGKKSRGSRAEGTEAMLGARKGDSGRVDKRKKEALKNLNSRREKRDGAVRSTQIRGFTRLRDRDDMGCLPYRREVSMLKGKIEEVSEVRDAFRAKVL